MAVKNPSSKNSKAKPAAKATSKDASKTQVARDSVTGRFVKADRPPKAKPAKASNKPKIVDLSGETRVKKGKI